MAAQSTTTNASPNGESGQTLADILVGQKSLDPARAQQVKTAEIQTGKTQRDIAGPKYGY